MSRSPMRRLTSGCALACALALMTPAALADHVPGTEGRLLHFEVRPAAGQVAMVPVGEGDLTGWHLRVAVSAGALQTALYHGGCGRTLVQALTGERFPAFAPVPMATGDGPATGPACGSEVSPGTVRVDRRPGFLPDADLDVLGRGVPVLPGGGAPQPAMESPDPACFGWLELVVDATGLPVGAQVIATVELFAPGAPLDAPPTRVESIVAATVTR